MSRFNLDTTRIILKPAVTTSGDRGFCAWSSGFLARSLAASGMVSTMLIRVHNVSVTVWTNPTVTAPYKRNGFRYSSLVTTTQTPVQNIKLKTDIGVLQSSHGRSLSFLDDATKSGPRLSQNYKNAIKTALSVKVQP